MTKKLTEREKIGRNFQKHSLRHIQKRHFKVKTVLWNPLWGKRARIKTYKMVVENFKRKHTHKKRISFHIYISRIHIYIYENRMDEIENRIASDTIIHTAEKFKRPKNSILKRSNCLFVASSFKLCILPLF